MRNSCCWLWCGRKSDRQFRRWSRKNNTPWWRGKDAFDENIEKLQAAFKKRMSATSTIQTIISKESDEVVAVIEVFSKNGLKIQAKIIENKFPPNLVDLINNSIVAANELSFAVFDEIESEISSYKLFLKELNTEIFDLYINDSIMKFRLKGK